MADRGHAPVLLREAIDMLAPVPGGRYLDATFGGGGHSRALLAATAPDGIVLALDADPLAIQLAAQLAKEFKGRLRPVHANFADLARMATDAGLGPLNGVLLDLGVSSFQLDAGERGFAFRFDGPLDMRFDPARGEPAASLIERLSADELADLIYQYGDEPKSRRIAAAIVRERAQSPIRSTARFAEIVAKAAGGRRGRDTHPATRTFQALRIATNDELRVLERALNGAVGVLAPGGRLVTIAFHSLEDRIIKRFIERESAKCLCPPEVPICVCGHQPRLARVTHRALRPSAAETARNPRSRSATLRAAERLAERAAPETEGHSR